MCLAKGHNEQCTSRGPNQGPLGPKSDPLTTAPVRPLSYITLSITKVSQILSSIFLHSVIFLNYFVGIWNKSTFYYIQSSEIQENIVDIFCIFYIFTSENIKSYIFTPQEWTYNFFGLPLTFPLTYCSALQKFKRP